MGTTKKLSTAPARAVSTPAHPGSSGEAAPEPCKVTDILASIGEVPYEWDIASDALAWGTNAQHVLKVADAAAIATDGAFAGLICAGSTHSRRDAVLRSEQDDAGAGVAYQVQYSIRAAGETTPMWIEDTGRWFAGPDGRPAPRPWHGARHQRTPRPGRAVVLSLPLRRSHRRDEPPAAHRRARRHACGRRSGRATSFAMLVVSIDDLARINEAYGFAVGDEVISAVVLRLRASMRGERQSRPALRQQVRADPARVRSGRTHGRGRTPASRRARRSHTHLDRAGGGDRLARRHRRPTPRPDRPRIAVARRTKRSMPASCGGAARWKYSAPMSSARRCAARTCARATPSSAPSTDAASSRPSSRSPTRCRARPAFYECLMRIGRPDGTLIGAHDVMPIAERLGLVRLIDHRMLELVIAELGEVPDLRLSVNVSPDFDHRRNLVGCAGGFARRTSRSSRRGSPSRSPKPRRSRISTRPAPSSPA